MSQANWNVDNNRDVPPEKKAFLFWPGRRWICAVWAPGVNWWKPARWAGQWQQKLLTNVDDVMFLWLIDWLTVQSPESCDFFGFCKAAASLESTFSFLFFSFGLVIEFSRQTWSFGLGDFASLDAKASTQWMVYCRQFGHIVIRFSDLVKPLYHHNNNNQPCVFQNKKSVTGLTLTELHSIDNGRRFRLACSAVAGRRRKIFDKRPTWGKKQTSFQSASEVCLLAHPSALHCSYCRLRPPALLPP